MSFNSPKILNSLLYIVRKIFFGEKMAQAFIDHEVMEVLGQSTSFSQVYIDLVVMEVLGYFKFGYVQVDLIVTEVLGQIPHYVYIDEFVLECIGQWAGF
jgi:hypothetical protein